MADLHTRFHPKYNADLIELLRRFPIFRPMLAGEPGTLSIKPLLESSHQTTARLSRMVTSRYFDGNAGGVDVIDLMQRLDTENKAAFLAWLGEQ